MNKALRIVWPLDGGRIATPPGGSPADFGHQLLLLYGGLTASILGYALLMRDLVLMQAILEMVRVGLAACAGWAFSRRR